MSDEFVTNLREI